jgi:Glycosyltransferase 61
MINKIYRRIGRTLGKAFRLEDYAADTITLCPEEVQTIPLPVYLPEHLDRITGVAIFDELEPTIASLRQTQVIHAPSLMIPLGKTRLFGGGLWSKNNVFVARNLNPNDHFPKVKLAQAVVTDSDIGVGFFGHWLRDVTTSNLIGTDEIPALAMVSPPFAHAIQYSQLFNLKAIYANSGTVDNLFILSDHSQNSFKRTRYLQFRERLANNLKPEIIDYKGVFIARGQSGKNRAVVNEEEVIAFLQNQGFDVIYPETMQPADIIKKLWGAKIVVTVEGSAHNHAMFSMALDGVLLHLQPPQRFGGVIRGVCNCLGIGWGFYVCQPAADGNGFYVDSLPDLARIMAQLLDGR